MRSSYLVEIFTSIRRNLLALPRVLEDYIQAWMLAQKAISKWQRMLAGVGTFHQALSKLIDSHR
jgi:hypothetical protein